ncbi:MAG: ATP-binding protein [Candidatus Omnitrophica bacterium]|nr:ATP-binding protein [Candidatus Omnitrophota bacterium]
MYIRQKQLDNLINSLKFGKVHVIYGARRCGKTTLLKKFIEEIQKTCLFVSGEDIAVQDILSSQSIEKLKGFVRRNRYVIIDEAQKIDFIGLNLKLIVDHIPDVAVIATGSSAFDLARKMGEPLTGRKMSFHLFPLAQMELASRENTALTQSFLESRLLYGSYPEVVLEKDNREKEIYLRELVASYLYRDILEFETIRNSDKLSRLLQMIAFQIGKEVSLTEIGSSLGISKNTVARYMDLLEKCFVIFRVGGFSRNLRKEVSKSSRYYFFDVGIRNALIKNFNSLNLRNDVGMLWENYIIAERLKKQAYDQMLVNNYFWRTYDQKEIDWVEERDGGLFGYEMKYGKKQKRIPKEWIETYAGAQFSVIDQENYIKFIV